MKKILWFLLPIFILAATAVSASAAQYVYDYADVLTASEEAYLEEFAESESNKYGVSIVLLTEDGINGENPLLYAADFYDYGGFRDDGVILFLEMEERDWEVVNTGSFMDVIGDYELDYIADYAITHFSSGNYKTGFEKFIIIASDLYDNYINGYYDDDYYNDYYGDSYYNEIYPSGGRSPMFYVIAVVISLIVAFIVCSCFKKQLNSAVKQTNASNYLKDEDAQVTHSMDRFLYSRTTKIRKSSDSSNRSGGGSRSSFSGSSGRSHSGGGGKF